MRKISLWIETDKPDIYPMVMFQDNLSQRLHHRVTKASLDRLAKTVRKSDYEYFIAGNGWTAEKIDNNDN